MGSQEDLRKRSLIPTIKERWSGGPGMKKRMVQALILLLGCAVALSASAQPRRDILAGTTRARPTVVPPPRICGLLEADVLCLEQRITRQTEARLLALREEQALQVVTTSPASPTTSPRTSSCSTRCQAGPSRQRAACLCTCRNGTMVETDGHMRCQTQRAVLVGLVPRVQVMEGQINTLTRRVSAFESHRTSGRCERQFNEDRTTAARFSERAQEALHRTNVQALLCQALRQNHLAIPAGSNCDTIASDVALLTARSHQANEEASRSEAAMREAYLSAHPECREELGDSTVPPQGDELLTAAAPSTH